MKLFNWKKNDKQTEDKQPEGERFGINELFEAYDELPKHQKRALKDITPIREYKETIESVLVEVNDPEIGLTQDRYIRLIQNVSKMTSSANAFQPRPYIARLPLALRALISSMRPGSTGLVETAHVLEDIRMYTWPAIPLTDTFPFLVAQDEYLEYLKSDARVIDRTKLSLDDITGETDVCFDIFENQLRVDHERVERGYPPLTPLLFSGACRYGRNTNLVKGLVRKEMITLADYNYFAAATMIQVLRNHESPFTDRALSILSQMIELGGEEVLTDFASLYIFIDQIDKEQSGISRIDVTTTLNRLLLGVFNARSKLEKDLKSKILNYILSELEEQETGRIVSAKELSDIFAYSYPATREEVILETYEDYLRFRRRLRSDALPPLGEDEPTVMVFQELADYLKKTGVLNRRRFRMSTERVIRIDSYTVISRGLELTYKRDIDKINGKLYVSYGHAEDDPSDDDYYVEFELADLTTSAGAVGSGARLEFRVFYDRAAKQNGKITLLPPNPTLLNILCYHILAQIHTEFTQPEVSDEPTPGDNGKSIEQSMPRQIPGEGRRARMERYKQQGPDPVHRLRKQKDKSKNGGQSVQQNSGTKSSKEIDPLSLAFPETWKELEFCTPSIGAFSERGWQAFVERYLKKAGDGLLDREVKPLHGLTDGDLQRIKAHYKGVRISIVVRYTGGRNYDVIGIENRSGNYKRTEIRY